MKLINYLLLPVLFLWLTGCDTGGDDLSELFPITSTYHIYDSVVVEINTFNNNTWYTHHPMDKNMSLILSGDKQTLWINQDTFQYNYPYGYLRNGSFPIIQLENDSILIKEFGGGVGFQTWMYMYGVKQ